MIKVMKKQLKRLKSSARTVEEILKLEKDLKKLPDLSDIERVKLDQERALSHLYYSSNIEGTKLTNKQIERAIYGEKEKGISTR